MKVGVIGEGPTEYRCVPSLVARLNHRVVGVHDLGGIGGSFPWDKAILLRVYPYVRSFAVRGSPSRPDKVIVVVDREDRPECCGALAGRGCDLIRAELAKEGLEISTSIVLANRQFECWLFAQPELLDGSPIFKVRISSLINSETDEKNILSMVNASLKQGRKWDKPGYGKALAQRLELTNPAVLGRSRSLRKFVKELQADPCEQHSELAV